VVSRPRAHLREECEDGEVALTDWRYNAWGDKYPPFDLDNEIPPSIAQKLKLQRFENDMVLEGGSIDVNGKGLLLTSEQCLLNKNRNPHLTRAQIEKNLRDYLGSERRFYGSVMGSSVTTRTVTSMTSPVSSNRMASSRASRLTAAIQTTGFWKRTWSGYAVFARARGSRSTS
jgi:agmatine/peptidylarginine deiminase